MLIIIIITINNLTNFRLLIWINKINVSSIFWCTITYSMQYEYINWSQLLVVLTDN